MMSLKLELDEKTKKFMQGMGRKLPPDVSLQAYQEYLFKKLLVEWAQDVAFYLEQHLGYSKYYLVDTVKRSLQSEKP